MSVFSCAIAATHDTLLPHPLLTLTFSHYTTHSGNERGFNTTYLETLRGALNTAGFSTTKLIAADSSFSQVAAAVNADPVFAQSIWGLGAHYPNMVSGAAAQETGKALWASEEDSTYNNAVGSACWARVINQNYVRGNMTASINWNLIAAYMKGTQWWRAGLMTAFQPWSGHYGSLSMLYATAHTTQFTKPGWSYLLVGTNGSAGTGSGLLNAGGSYVTIEDFGSAVPSFSIIIEKMSRDHSPCCRPGLAQYNVSQEIATFMLTGVPSKVTTLRVWKTHWSFGGGDVTEEFIEQTPITVIGHSFTITIDVDSLYTITTVTSGHKGTFAAPPPPATFPEMYSNDFESCAASSEGAYFSDQNGAWECQPKSNDPTHGVVMRQMVPFMPIGWGGDIRPHSLIGSRDLVNTSMWVDARLTAANGSLILGARLNGTTESNGIIFSFNTEGAWNVTGSMSKVQATTAIASGSLSITLPVDSWHTFQLDVNGTVVQLSVDGKVEVSSLDVQWAGSSGHNGVGTVQFGHYTEIDNFFLYSTQVSCSAAAPVAGNALKAVSCASEVGPRLGGQVIFTPLDASTCPFGSPCAGSKGTFSPASDLSLCFAVVTGVSTDDWPIILATCDASSPAQIFAQDYTMLYNSQIQHVDSSRNICLSAPDVGSFALAHYKAPSTCESFVYVGDEQEIVSINSGSICLGFCE